MGELGHATGCTLGEGHDRGRRGTVFFGVDRSTGEGVAVKVPHAGEEAIVEAESRHCRRIREQLDARDRGAATALMCPILRRGRVGAAGTPFHVMPRYPATLRSWGAAPRPAPEWAGLLLQALYLAEALRGVDTFHGDYRPFNVMVAEGEGWSAPPGATVWNVPLPAGFRVSPAARVIDWEQSQLVQGRRAREHRFSAGLRNLKDEVTLLHALWRWGEIEAAYAAVGGTHCDDRDLAAYVREHHPRHAARLDAGAKAYQVFDACMEEEAAAAAPGPVPAAVRAALGPVFDALARSRKASGLQVGYVIDDATGNAVRAALPGCVQSLVGLCDGVGPAAATASAGGVGATSPAQRK